MVPTSKSPWSGVLLVLASALPAGAADEPEVSADLDYSTTVEHPTYLSVHPTVRIDAAHNNYHTADGFYRPLANLLRSDGYEVLANDRPLSRAALEGVTVLVIANALPPTTPATGPTFTADELKVLREWVLGGGSLLLIADHVPFGAASQSLAGQFNVHMGQGIVFDLPHSSGNPTFLLFDRPNDLLGTHPILLGRNPAESVGRVVAFAGQSLSTPPGATVLLRLGDTAYEAASQDAVRKALDALKQNGMRSDVFSANARRCEGNAQGVALPFGRGRVVVVGEAALFSAQILKMTQDGKPWEMRFGMNAPGNDDRQFVLNVLHWLSRVL